jgi:hypothetical protein
MIHPAPQAPATVRAARPVPCALDRHLGPFDPIPELDGWLAADWCVCRACRSTITATTALKQRSAA